ncbi:hypothetical protein [Mycobacterium marinum]|uniref:hypothetical protein n=1 Tax=Mycobacterium marinum TaxID=1781 RepID=UPI0035692A3E
MSPAQPQTLLEESLTAELRDLPFNIHAPHNLDPGCRSCNTEKGNRDLLSAPRFMTLPSRARELEPAVIRTVRKFHSGKALTTALATVTGVDSNDPDTMQTLAELGPALITRLRCPTLETDHTINTTPHQSHWQKTNSGRVRDVQRQGTQAWSCHPKTSFGHRS